jgi:hypothetical protein
MALNPPSPVRDPDAPASERSAPLNCWLIGLSWVLLLLLIPLALFALGLEAGWLPGGPHD